MAPQWARARHSTIFFVYHRLSLKIPGIVQFTNTNIINLHSGDKKAVLEAADDIAKVAAIVHVAPNPAGKADCLTGPVLRACAEGGKFLYPARGAAKSVPRPNASGICCGFTGCQSPKSYCHP